jgi:hypothetical protein
MAKDKNLHFNTYEDAAEWFDTHDMSDYKDEMIPVDFQFDLRRNREWVELERDIAKGVRKLAREQHIPTRKLVNELLKERLENSH